MEKRKRLFEIVEVGAATDFYSRLYDFISTFVLVLNLVISVLLTFHRVSSAVGGTLLLVERVTAVFFAVDYVLRLITARCRDEKLPEGLALLKYIISLMGIVDLLSFLPYFLPFFFPAGAAVFRMFRVVRIFRLFRLNAYYDAINVITEVFKSKKQQLLSSIFIIFILMVASSLCMYSLEHEAQPDVFVNAFSGLWWSVATLMTVGYGDIYPITTLGQIFSIVITFLGVLIVAIPSGIISAGFVEQYTRLKQIGEMNAVQDLNLIRVPLDGDDPWVNKKIQEVSLPTEMLITLIQRGNELLMPRDDVQFREGDVVIIGAESLEYAEPLNIKEICIGNGHEWANTAIRDLDISRQSYILMIRRGEALLTPHGDFVIQEGDEVIVYTKKKSDF